MRQRERAVRQQDRAFVLFTSVILAVLISYIAVFLIMIATPAEKPSMDVSRVTEPMAAIQNRTSRGTHGIAKTLSRPVAETSELFGAPPASARMPDIAARTAMPVIEAESVLDPVPDNVPEARYDMDAALASAPVIWTENDVATVAKTVYGEAWCTQSDTHMSAVVWCILNRVDDPTFPSTPAAVATQPGQFYGYQSYHPVEPRVYDLVLDVFRRWSLEKSDPAAADAGVGRTLPASYLYFVGDGYRNHYTENYHGTRLYDWSLNSPYD